MQYSTLDDSTSLSFYQGEEEEAVVWLQDDEGLVANAQRMKIVPSSDFRVVKRRRRIRDLKPIFDLYMQGGG